MEQLILTYNKHSNQPTPWFNIFISILGFSNLELLTDTENVLHYSNIQKKRLNREPK